MSTEFILIRPVGVSALLEEGLNSMHAQGPLCGGSGASLDSPKQGTKNPT